MPLILSNQEQDGLSGFDRACMCLVTFQVFDRNKTMLYSAYPDVEKTYRKNIQNKKVKIASSLILQHWNVEVIH